MNTNRIHTMQWHEPNWHTLQSRFARLVRDPRFWAVVIVGGLALLTLAVSIWISPSQTVEPYHYKYPMYPFLP